MRCICYSLPYLLTSCVVVVVSVLGSVVAAFMRRRIHCQNWRQRRKPWDCRKPYQQPVKIMMITQISHHWLDIYYYIHCIISVPRWTLLQPYLTLLQADCHRWGHSTDPVRKLTDLKVDRASCCCCCDSPAALLLSSVVQVEEVCDRSQVVPQVLHCKLRQMALTVEQMLYGVWCYSTHWTNIWYAAGHVGLVQKPTVTRTQLGESSTDWPRQQTFKRWDIGWWSSKDSLWYKIRFCFYDCLAVEST